MELLFSAVIALAPTFGFMISFHGVQSKKVIAEAFVLLFSIFFWLSYYFEIYELFLKSFSISPS